MEMIKKLRRRLVGVSMLSLLMVLLTIISAVSLLNYRELIRDADEILDLLEENNGTFPEHWGTAGTAAVSEGNVPAPPADKEEATAGEDMTLSEKPSGEDDAPPEKPSGEGGAPPEKPSGEDNTPPGQPSDTEHRRIRSALRGKLSVETPFESRYFTVTVASDGATSVETGRIAAVDEEEALALAQEVLAKNRLRGFSGDYRYRVVQAEAQTLVIFLDRGRNLALFYSFLITSCGTALLGLLIVFALISYFSGRITRPFVDNYEKQRRFITDAGHELKTPLAIIEADADVLEMDLGEDNEWLQDIQKQTGRLADLTKNLISLARMEEGGNHFTMIDFPVSEVVAEAAESYRGPALSHGQIFDVNVEPLLTLHGDEAAVRQLVGILMDNALKYSGEGGSIALSLSRQGKNLLLRVSNTAEHVSRESTAHLFERFYRADASRSTGGYGIGLSIAQAIVTAHRGRIQAGTRDEKSLDITATFPGCSAAEGGEAL